MQASNANYIPTPVGEQNYLHDTISEVTINQELNKYRIFCFLLQSVSPPPPLFDHRSGTPKKKRTTSKLKKVPSKTK
jgi:hypothetical protein